jgi:adenosylhomocysteine nucleosidase
MEGAAIAQSCYLNEVPFVIIRAISDKADGSAHEDYDEFVKKAAKRSAAAVIYLLENENP